MYFQLETETVRHKNAANPAGRRLSPPMSLACLCARCGEAKNALPPHRGNSAYGPLHYLRQAPVVSPTLARTPDLLATKVRPRIGQGGIVVTTIPTLAGRCQAYSRYSSTQPGGWPRVYLPLADLIVAAAAHRGVSPTALGCDT